MTKYDSFRPFRKEQTLTNQNQASREITVRDSVFPKDKNRETEVSLPFLCIWAFEINRLII